MKRPIRATLVYGLACALLVVPAATLLAVYIGWSLAFNLMLGAALCGYTILLVRWSGKGLGRAALPLSLLMGAAVWPGIEASFLFLALGMLCWLRSGICFNRYPIRAIAAETISTAGSAGLIVLLNPVSTISWSISIWLFFLMQALYFFIVPVSNRQTSPPYNQDSFEQAHREARQIMEDAG